MEKTVQLFSGEYWYGYCVDDGVRFPISIDSEYDRSLLPNCTENQAGSMLVSNLGRYLWSKQGTLLSCHDGTLKMEAPKGQIYYGEGHKTLKEAFCYVMEHYSKPDGICPPEEFFTKPQYNTWIELMYDQSQERILNYAETLLKEGYSPGILMIDDGWAEDYGEWRFRADKFNNPKEMVKKLHELGFTIMLWTCPFISPDSVAFRHLKQIGALVCNADGTIAIREWWNGFSAVLDFTNPDAREWYQQQNQILIDQYDIDGFKLDAGDGKFYRDDDITYAPTSANGQTQLWMEQALKYPFNELRAGFGFSGKALVNRLADKRHSWLSDGMAALVPNQLTQGILGYAFTCPDMIGGGEFSSFLEQSDCLDQELFVRYAQCSALMPMMQFSAAPWRILDKQHAELCLEAARLHKSYSERILSLAHEAKTTGEPITRYMEYEFPGQGMETITDQFMLGNNTLVAPVYQKGINHRSVKLPKGKWRYCDGNLYQGNQTVRVEAPLHCLPFFELEV